MLCSETLGAWQHENTGNTVVAEALKTADGKLDQHFVLDIFRTGSGASGNAAEVIVPSVTFLAE